MKIAQLREILADLDPQMEIGVYWDDFIWTANDAKVIGDLFVIDASDEHGKVISDATDKPRNYFTAVSAS